MKKMIFNCVMSLLILCGIGTRTKVQAHDTWVETPSLLARFNDWLYVDLRLGNHGNEHRDFKLASKITLAPCTLTLIAPNGQQQDLKPQLKDLGNAEKEGYWSARVVADQVGLYQVVHTLDTLHGKTRAIKSSKTLFVSKDQINTASAATASHTIGSGLEFLLDTHVHELKAGSPIALTVLWKGKPAHNVRVAFVPRGETLPPSKDNNSEVNNYERVSDQNGRVEFTPREGNLILAVAHYIAAEEKGENYDRTHYGATMVLPVPQQPIK